MGAHTICIALHDSSTGYPLSAARVPLGVLSAFTKDVEDFVRGDTHAAQGKAFDTKALEVALLPSGGLPRPIVISHETDFHSDDADAWVRIERYVRDHIEELGGHTNVNAHVRLADGSSLTVNASKELLAKEHRNRLYKSAMLRIRAELHLRTQQYRNAELLEFVEHERRVDERELERLARRGREAWQAVRASSTWLDEQRGYTP